MGAAFADGVGGDGGAQVGDEFGDLGGAGDLLEEGVGAAERLDDEAVAKKMAELFVTFKAGRRLEQ